MLPAAGLIRACREGSLHPSPSRAKLGGKGLSSWAQVQLGPFCVVTSGGEHRPSSDLGGRAVRAIKFWCAQQVRARPTWGFTCLWRTHPRATLCGSCPMALSPPAQAWTAKNEEHWPRFGSPSRIVGVHTWFQAMSYTRFQAFQATPPVAWPVPVFTAC